MRSISAYNKPPWLLLNFSEKVKRFTINISHSERGDDEKPHCVTEFVPVVGHDLVVPEVRGISRRWGGNEHSTGTRSQIACRAAIDASSSPKLPNAETRTCEARARVYSPPLSMLHGYVNVRMWRHGVSGDLPVGGRRQAAGGTSLSRPRDIGSHRESVVVINCGVVMLHTNDTMMTHACSSSLDNHHYLAASRQLHPFK